MKRLGDAIDRAMEIWYGRALLGFVLGSITAVLVAVVQTNLWPESHESWFRTGNYFVMPLISTWLFAILTTKARIRLERRFENFLAGIRRGLFRRDRRKQRR